MRVRVDVKHMVLPAQSMSRRERMALGEDIGRELSRLLQHGATTADGPRQRSVPSVVTQIAAAIAAAQLPPQPAHQRTGRRS
jgi:hypothetical protein